MVVTPSVIILRCYVRNVAVVGYWRDEHGGLVRLCSPVLQHDFRVGRCYCTLISHLKLRDAPVDSLDVKPHGINAEFVLLEVIVEGHVDLDVLYDPLLHSPVAG